MTVNQFDPTMKVVIVDVTNHVHKMQIPPKVLKFTPGKDSPGLQFPPNFEYPGLVGEAVYEVPRDYATRQLENAGGRVFRLVSPNKLIIQVSNGRGGTKYDERKAWKKLNGQWLEKTDEELLKEGTPTIPTSLGDGSKLNAKQDQKSAKAKE